MSKDKTAASSKTANSTKVKKLSCAGQAIINNGIAKRLQKMRDKDIITQEDYETALEQYGFTVTSNKNAAKKIANTATQTGEFSPDYHELKELADNDKMLDLINVMYEPKYFDFINDVLNTALKAAGIDPNDCGKNFAKLFCLYNLSYPIRYYCLQDFIQKKLTKDILEMNEPGEDLNKSLSLFFSFRDLIDPKETGMLNVSDERLREFMTA